VSVSARAVRGDNREGAGSPFLSCAVVVNTTSLRSRDSTLEHCESRTGESDGNPTMAGPGEVPEDLMRKRLEPLLVDFSTKVFEVGGGDLAVIWFVSVVASHADWSHSLALLLAMLGCWVIGCFQSRHSLRCSRVLCCRHAMGR
jgi:hypothetical protein